MKTRMSQMMNHRAVLLIAALAVLTLPLAAQQEVSPDHFDAQQVAARARKPKPVYKMTGNKSRHRVDRQNSAGTKAANKPQVSAALKSGLGGGSR